MSLLDEMLRAMHENRQAIDAYFEKVHVLAPSGKLVVISCNRIEGAGRAFIGVRRGGSRLERRDLLRAERRH